jgi:hypothetical protein
MSTQNAYRVLAAQQKPSSSQEFSQQLFTVKVYIEHARLDSDAAWTALEEAVRAESPDMKAGVCSVLHPDIQILNYWRLYQEDVPKPLQV